MSMFVPYSVAKMGFPLSNNDIGTKKRSFSIKQTNMFFYFFLPVYVLYVSLQDFVSDVHYFVVREYISQLMKNNYSCKSRKYERAATKIEVQWGKLCELFQEMVQ